MLGFEGIATSTCNSITNYSFAQLSSGNRFNLGTFNDLKSSVKLVSGRWPSPCLAGRPLDLIEGIFEYVYNGGVVEMITREKLILESADMVINLQRPRKSPKPSGLSHPSPQPSFHERRKFLRSVRDVLSHDESFAKVSSGEHDVLIDLPGCIL
jgi:hypothetical protein